MANARRVARPFVTACSQAEQAMLAAIRRMTDEEKRRAIAAAFVIQSKNGRLISGKLSFPSTCPEDDQCLEAVLATAVRPLRLCS